MADKRAQGLRAENERLSSENEELRVRLEEAEQALEAIRTGQAESLIVEGLEGPRIFSLEGADHSYRVLVEAMNEGAATFGEDGVVLYCNTRFAEMLEAPLERVMGDVILRFLPPPSREAFAALLREANGGESRGELELLRQDGKALPAFVSVSVIHDDTRRRYCLVAADLRAQKRSEAIVAAERLARSVLEQAADAIVVCDDSGRIIRASSSAADLCAGNPLLASFEQAFPVELSTPDWGDPQVSLLAKAMRGETVRAVPASLTLPDGTRADLLASAAALRDPDDRIVGYVVTLVDVTNLRRAEAALRQALSSAEERGWLLEAMMESIPLGITIADAPDVSVRQVSRYGRELIEKTSEELTAAAAEEQPEVWRFYHRDGVTLATLDELPLTRATVKGERVQGEEWLVARKDGAKIPIYCTAAPIRDARGEIRGGVVGWQDISERKAAEEALRESDARFRSVLTDSRDVIYRFNVQTDRFEYVSPSAEAVLGFSADELATLDDESMQAMIHPDDAAVMRAASERLEETGSAEAEYRQRNKNGEYRWLSNRMSLVRDSSGRPLYRNGSIRDTTERKRAEDALLQSERRYKSLAENTPAVLMRYGPDLRVLFLSPSAEQATGRPSSDFIGKTNREMGMPERFCDLWEEEISQVFRSREPREFEFPYPTPGGDRHFLLKLVPEYGSDQRVESVLGIATDITERQRAEEAVRAANLRLAEADQRKNQFLAVLSHELRNPLAPIKNSLYILQRAVPGGDQARRALDVIDRQTGQLARLVDDLLDVTRITRNKIQLQRRRLELNELVRRTLDDHRSQFEKGEISLELVPAPAPVYVNADWNRMAQVIGNLLQNAAKFTGRYGLTRVLVEVDEVARQAIVRVADTGVGMAPELLSRLFEPFSQADETLDRSKGGLGLGLALVKGLMELHGGAVAARSEGLGKGAEFVLRLPLELPELSQPETVCQAVRGKHRRVLIIEDNADAADSLSEALGFGDHVVQVAYNGPEGLARAREFRPDIVLCDIGLPGMDGYEVARAFRADAALKDTHLVALTGYALPEDLQRASDAGFERHLAKPPSLEKLEQLLAEVSGAASYEGRS